ncbi:MAG: hypothetical protein AUJ01_07925 [Acidobacteria bacterium 13_1_40CM_3_65_5]|nr:MAG: hypothetical protein AUJ01_07925 [Acidobacteria bacterium 13_1_40CM_3_65_5]
MRILLVGDYPRDARLGSTKVLLKLQEEFRRLGHTCDVLLADDLGASPRHRLLRWALAPVTAFAAIRRAFREHGPYDVVDAASAEGLWVGVLRGAGLFNGAALIARSNGLEHLNYRRMLEDHDAGLLDKPWTRRWWYPAVRLSQVAAAARVADRLILLNGNDRAFGRTASLHDFSLTRRRPIIRVDAASCSAARGMRPKACRTSRQRSHDWSRAVRRYRQAAHRRRSRCWAAACPRNTSAPRSPRSRGRV